MKDKNMPNEFQTFDQWYESRKQYLVSYLEVLSKNPPDLLFPSEEFELEYWAFRRNPKIGYMFEKMIWEARYNKKVGGK